MDKTKITFELQSHLDGRSASDLVLSKSDLWMKATFLIVPNAQRYGKDSLGRYRSFRHWIMASLRKPMICPKCYTKISFFSSLFRRSNLSFKCPNCKSRVGVSLDKRYWIRQLITAPIYIYAIATLTNFHDLDSIFSLRNISMVLLIGVIGTYEGWRLFWFLELKDKAHK